MLVLVLVIPHSRLMTLPDMRSTEVPSEANSRAPSMNNNAITNRVVSLSEEALHCLRGQRDRITGRAFIRSAMALMGEPVGGADESVEKDVAGESLDEQDYHEMCHNAEGILRKLKESAKLSERENVVSYLKSFHRLLGNGTGSGSLTPRPRDYAAAMSRIGEGSMSSPAEQRLSTHMERLEHAHSHTNLRP
jgi:hypothetical protein